MAEPEPAGLYTVQTYSPPSSTETLSMMKVEFSMVGCTSPLIVQLNVLKGPPSVLHTKL